MNQLTERRSGLPAPCASSKVNGDACRASARWRCGSCNKTFCGVHIRREREALTALPFCQLCAAKVTQFRTRYGKAEELADRSVASAARQSLVAHGAEVART